MVNRMAIAERKAKRFMEQALTCLNKPFRVDELMSIIEARASGQSVSTEGGAR